MALYLNGTECKNVYYNGTKLDHVYKNGTQVYTSFTPVSLNFTLNTADTAYKSGGTPFERGGYSAVTPAFTGTTQAVTGSTFCYTLEAEFYAYKSNWSGVNETYTIQAYLGNAEGDRTIYLGEYKLSKVTANKNFTVTFTANDSAVWIGNAPIYLTIWHRTDDSAQSKLYLRNSTVIRLKCENAI